MKMNDQSQAQRVASDCRQMPSEKNCSLYIEGTKAEVMMVAMHHAIEAHGHTDNPELYKEVESMVKPV